MVCKCMTTEITYSCDIARLKFRTDTGALYFERLPDSTTDPARVRELAALLNDIAITMEAGV